MQCPVFRKDTGGIGSAGSKDRQGSGNGNDTGETGGTICTGETGGTGGTQKANLP
jgi:hypothetical protein